MSFKDDNPGYEIKSEDQARNWILELVSKVEQTRNDCNISFPGNTQKTSDWQRKAYRKYLINHGSALGALMALHRSAKISDIAYNDLRGRVLQTLMPTIVGANSN